MRKEEHKLLSFSTTIRNPERISEFVNCIKEFEGQILTNALIMQIVKKVIRNKLYRPTCITKDSILKDIYNNQELSFNDLQLEYIIEKSPQNHKEAGFEKGWPSRFDTWYKLCKEFGFVFYEMNKKIEISPSGHMLCDAYLDKSGESGEKIQKIFLNSLSKYQTNNPFRRTSTNNTPIPLLLNVLKLLNKENNSVGISRKELSFFICWNNDDYVELYKFIINFRKVHGFNSSSETIYEECLKLLNSNNRKRFKMSQVLKESVDDLIRKLRITGIFSLRGMGRFIDLNKMETSTINYIVKKYTKYKTYKSKYSYYKYMGSLDPIIISSRVKKVDNLDEIRLTALKKFSVNYTKTQVFKEIKNLQFNIASKDEYLKLIDAPTRLEFLTSLAIMQKFPDYDVRPNYAIDDEGNPTFTAKGGLADIEVYASDLDSLIEVTLMTSKQQTVNEIPSIVRHLKDLNEKSDKTHVFSIFVAPYVHSDSILMCQFIMYKDNLGIYPYNITEFIKKLDASNSLLGLKYNV